MVFFRKLHKWLGLVIGIQFLVWMLSGFLINLIDQDEVSGSATRNPTKLSTALADKGPYISESALELDSSTVESITLGHFISRPAYIVVVEGRTFLFDAKTAERIEVTGEIAEEIALSSYRGSGNTLATERLASGSDEIRGVSGPVWRVDFDDDLGTRVYISEDDGEVLAHRNSSWKLFDFLLMLHFMDYAKVDSFNNPQIIVFGFATLWLAMSGLLLVINSFSRADFLWIPGIGVGGKTVTSQVQSAQEPRREIVLPGALSYYAALSQQDVKLPSNCDGSGSCGLCQIRYEENIPEHTAVDREWLNSDLLAKGTRLGCQHSPRDGDVILVPDVAFQQGTQSAEVVASHWLTPLLKEIRIRLQEPADFNPGDYFEFQVPVIDVGRDQMGVDDRFQAVWNDLQIPQYWEYADERAVSRTYSIASAPSTARPQDLTFTVRFAPPPTGLSCPPGAGSSYMCSLQPGDRIEFRGPMGQFRLHDTEREKIFIGGGAGMAPLRSMVLHLLVNRGWQGTLRFWYGARSQSEILYRDQFDALALKHINFEWQVSLSEADDDDDWRGHRGLIHETVFNEVLSPHHDVQQCEYYLCGPPPMLAATRQMLAELGVPDRQVRFDDFGN